MLTSSGLVRYVHPSDEELRDFSLAPKPDRKKKHRQRQETNGNSVFNVPRNLDLQLETAKVTKSDLVQLRYDPFPYELFYFSQSKCSILQGFMPSINGSLTLPCTLSLSTFSQRYHVIMVIIEGFYKVLTSFPQYFQAYITIFPTKATQEVNLSMLWCMLAVGFAYKILMSLTGLYFGVDESDGERSLVRRAFFVQCRKSFIHSW